MVVLVKDGNRWAEANTRSWESELELEQVLQNNPELIPGCEGAAVVTQFSIRGVGIADVVCVDDVGTITVIECKLAKNAEIRRSVVGQIFAYASGLSGTSTTDFAAEFTRRAGQSLVTAITDAAEREVDPDDLTSALSGNLEAGRFRLVVAVDAITSELRAIIEYLNVHLGDSVSIMAFELGRIMIGGTAVLVPTTYGAEVAERKLASGARRRWTVADLTDATAEVVSSGERQLVEALLAYAEASGAIIQGGSGRVPSAGFYYLLKGKRVSVWSLYVRPDGPVISLNLGSVKRASENLALGLLPTLRKSPTLADVLPTDDAAAVYRYTDFPARVITDDPTALQSFWAAIEQATGIPRP
jgi:hypothetical protein